MTPGGAVRVWKLDYNDNGLVEDDSIALGPDGNLWVDGLTYDDLVRFTPDGIATRIHAGDQADRVTAGPDGNLWFTYYYGVGHVAPDGSQRTLVPEPFGSQSDCGPFTGVGPDGGLAFAADGTLWAAASNSNSLERIAPGPAAPSPLDAFLPRRGALAGAANAIAADPGGPVWISVRHALIRVTAGGRQTVFRHGVGTRPGPLLPVRGGAVWFRLGRGIARLSRSGRVRRFTRGFGRRSQV